MAEGWWGTLQEWLVPSNRQMPSGSLRERLGAVDGESNELRERLGEVEGQVRQLRQKLQEVEGSALAAETREAVAMAREQSAERHAGQVVESCAEQKGRLQAELFEASVEIAAHAAAAQQAKAALEREQAAHAATLREAEVRAEAYSSAKLELSHELAEVRMLLRRLSSERAWPKPSEPLETRHWSPPRHRSVSHLGSASLVPSPRSASTKQSPHSSTASSPTIPIATGTVRRAASSAASTRPNASRSTAAT